ncbi:SET domain-containing protein 9 [Kappamyces sp. JEL0829]|nr:SET domain-containing protein 9 [Kappamyces sp. JEL0829]
MPLVQALVLHRQKPEQSIKEGLQSQPALSQGHLPPVSMLLKSPQLIGELSRMLLDIESAMNQTRASSVFKPHTHLAIRQSGIPHAGLGLFATRDIPVSSILCVYPGLVYEAWESKLLQSIGNHYILSMFDGKVLDAKPRGLSRMLLEAKFKEWHWDAALPRIATLAWLPPSTSGVYSETRVASTGNRAREIAPTSNPRPSQNWDSPAENHAFLLGHLINNGSGSRQANARYQELDIDPAEWPTFPWHLLPVLHSCPHWHPWQDNRRVVVILATLDIKQGQEILTTYHENVT